MREKRVETQYRSGDSTSSSSVSLLEQLKTIRPVDTRTLGHFSSILFSAFVVGACDDGVVAESQPNVPPAGPIAPAAEITPTALATESTAFKALSEIKMTALKAAERQGYQIVDSNKAKLNEVDQKLVDEYQLSLDEQLGTHIIGSDTVEISETQIINGTEATNQFAFSTLTHTRTGTEDVTGSSIMFQFKLADGTIISTPLFNFTDENVDGKVIRKFAGFYNGLSFPAVIAVYGENGAIETLSLLKPGPNDSHNEFYANVLMGDSATIEKHARAKVHLLLNPAMMEINGFDAEGNEIALNVPDPRVTNPELFNTNNPNSPIFRFAKAFGINPEEVGAGLHVEMETPDGMPAFTVLRTADGVALVMATQDENGNWLWQEAIPGRYWAAQDKWSGFYIKNYHLKYLTNYLQLDKFADGGILALSGQANPNNEAPGDKPINARDYFKMAKDNNMSFDFNYVIEPGRFPDGINSENVDQWFNTRLNEIIIEEININNPDQPVLLQLNEAWDTRSGNWNPDSNPLRDKYGEQWIEEYIYQTLDVSISKGLDVNSDFVLMFNENGMFNNPQKQRIVHDKLVQARKNAFDRLAADPITMIKLQEMGITKSEDIQILMGAQMHIKLGEQGDGHIFMREPSTDEINSFADLFGDLGGIIMTEVNPNGNEDQKAGFLAKITNTMANNPNIKGFIIWNPVPDDENGEDIFKISPTFLFNGNGSPTQLFFELLRESASN